jgi:hypothetical protein
LHVLHLLGVSAAKVAPAGSKKATKKQIKDKTKISNVLSAAVGLTLQARRDREYKRRTSQDAESCYSLAVTRPVQDIIDRPSELVAEHWYRRKYNREPPHLDALYTGDVPLTDENRAELKQIQHEEHERTSIALQEEAEAGRKKALLEKQEQNKRGCVAAIVAAVEPDIEQE